MAALPIEVLLGVYLGILTGIIPGLVSWSLGFGFKYTTGVTIPGFGVVVLALAIAGVNGGILALNDPAIRRQTSGPAILTAILVVLMISLYAHSKGDAMGAAFPKRVSLGSLRRRTLSTDVVELVGGRSQVRITVKGEVLDMEGYPPVPDDIRRAIKDGEWTFPADLPVPELETRFAERLRTEFDLADVSIQLDEKARATIVAAPPLSGLSRRVPPGRRAVSVEALVPTGLARGDEVDVVTEAGTVHGTVLSARSGDGGKGAPVRAAPEAEATTSGEPGGSGGDAVAPDGEPGGPPAPTTTGGEGRVTVAVTRSEAEALLRVSRARVVVTARGHRREYELISLLRRAGKRFRRLTVRPGGALDGATLGSTPIRDDHGVAILAVRRPDGWVMVPRGTTTVEAGDDLFVVGPPGSLDTFAEVTA